MPSRYSVTAMRKVTNTRDFLAIGWVFREAVYHEVEMVYKNLASSSSRRHSYIT
jgi:hypothetical protein